MAIISDKHQVGTNTAFADKNVVFTVDNVTGDLIISKGVHDGVLAEICRIPNNGVGINAGTLNGLAASALAKVGINSDITDLSGLLSINGGPLSGLRNRVINGACRVSQRANPTVTAGQSAYTSDQYITSSGSTSGATIRGEPATLTYNGRSKPSVRCTSIVPPTLLTGSGDAFVHGIWQPIESYNCYDLYNKPMTLSFIFNSNVSGTFSVALRNSNVTFSYVSSFVAVANTPRKVEINIPATTLFGYTAGNTTGLHVTVGLIGAFYNTPAENTWAAGNYLSTASSTNWAAAANNFIEIAELQLEEGTKASPFEHIPYPLDLMLCQRYYETGYSIFSGNVLVGNGHYALGTYKVPKRVPATLAVTSIAGAGFDAATPNFTGYNSVFGFNAMKTANGNYPNGYFDFVWTASAVM